MKKILLVAVSALLMAACSNKGAVINGTVQGMDNAMVYLQKSLGKGKFEKIDSTTVVDGKFKFESSEVYPDVIYVTFADQPSRFMFLLENGQINVNCDFDSESLFAGSGTPANDLYSAFNTEINSFNPQREEIISRFYKARSEQDSVAMAAARGELDKIDVQLEEKTNKFIADNKASLAAAYVLSQQSTYGYTPEKMDSVIGILDVAMPANAFIDRLKERRSVLERIAPGQPAPDIKMMTADGVELSLSSLPEKCVIIDFWASWCNPCREENPRMVEIFNKYKDLGLTIYGVSLDTDRAAWLKGVADDGLTWHHVSDLNRFDCQAVRDYGVVAIPHTVVVSDGKIVANVVFGDELEGKVREVLGVE